MKTQGRADVQKNCAQIPVLVDQLPRKAGISQACQKALRMMGRDKRAYQDKDSNGFIKKIKFCKCPVTLRFVSVGREKILNHEDAQVTKHIVKYILMPFMTTTTILSTDITFLGILSSVIVKQNG